MQGLYFLDGMGRRLGPWALAWMVVWLGGCGGDDAGAGRGGVQPCVEGATQPCACADGSAGVQSCSGSAMGACVCGGAEADGGGRVLDVAAGDGGGGVGDCPGGAGCACSDNSDCQTGLCIDDPQVAGGRACAKKCEGACADGYSCAAVPAVSGDIVSICVPKFLHLCEPCSSSKDCAALGLKDPACVDQGPLGRFCGVACSGNSDCPDGYSCTAVATAEGGQLKQCVRLADAGQQPFGVCPCSDAAVQKKLATACYTEVQDGSGKSIGQCKGTRTCTAAGLSVCTAGSPKAEVCNGQDDDCDGQTDESSCDDGNPCTQDSCDGQGGCGHKALDGQPCDADGSLCTQNDTCQGSTCVAGAKKNCDDKNPCTADSCDPASGCTQTADDGAPCDDDNPCTLGDVCKAAQCQAGAPKVCAAPDGCTLAKCSLVTGNCSYSNAPDTTPCDDGLPCTTADACLGGICAGKAKSCDDGIACTEDFCDPKQGCASQPKGAVACDDGNACSGPDLCSGGGCSGAAKACDDQNPCTADSCDPTQGCQHAPSSGPCDDGNPCSSGDTCLLGKCAAGQGVCACTQDSDCPDDGDLCNGKLACDKSGPPASWACKVVAGSVPVCGGSPAPCQQAVCQAKTGQCAAVAAADGSGCDDGSACTLADSCAGGACSGGKTAACDDLNPCTADTCLPQSGCQHTAIVQPCDADGSVCSVGDTCQGGVCTKGKALLCDDGNPCTSDACDPKTGCTSVANSAPCDDGNPCSSGDSCSGGACVPGKSVCGCQQDGDCPDDGNLCNGVQVCDKAQLPYKCAVKAGSVVQCSTAGDGGCKQTACAPQTGQCATTTLADGIGCADGNACTAGDQCGGGVCKAGSAVSCDDQNPCTADSCDPAKGCVSVPTAATLPCYAGPPATAAKGICKAGVQACDSQGVLGACTGAVLPAVQEACNGLDDTCDGQTDEGCKVEDFEVAQATVRYQASGPTYASDVRVGQALASGPVTAIGAQLQAWLGSWRWWKGLSP